jgi:hypothetical protein
MSHPQMTATVATQRCHEISRRAERARLERHTPHGIRVVHQTAKPQASRSVWTRIVTAFEKAGTVAPAPEPKLA